MSDPFDYRDGELYWNENRGYNKTKGKRAGRLMSSGYRQVTIDTKKHYEHRVIWEMHNGPIPPNREIHHINGVRDDNRIENLELVTHQENLHRIPVKKGYITRSRTPGKYYASIRSNGKEIDLGVFDTPDRARKAYISAKKYYHGVIIDE